MHHSGEGPCNEAIQYQAGYRSGLYINVHEKNCSWVEQWRKAKILVLCSKICTIIFFIFSAISTHFPLTVPVLGVLPFHQPAKMLPVTE